MVYRPDLRNGVFDVVPMDYMTGGELEQLGWQMHDAVADAATHDWLIERHLDGVVGRHDTVDHSRSAVARAHTKHLSTNDDHFGLLLDGSEWIGMGSLMPSLPLRAPTAASGLLPAKITRASRYLATPVI